VPLAAINGHRRPAASASGARRESYCCRWSKHLAAVNLSRRKRTWSR